MPRTPLYELPPATVAVIFELVSVSPAFLSLGFQLVALPASTSHIEKPEGIDHWFDPDAL